MRELRDRRDGGRVIATRRHFWRLLATFGTRDRSAEIDMAGEAVTAMIVADDGGDDPLADRREDREAAAARERKAKVAKLNSQTVNAMEVVRAQQAAKPERAGGSLRHEPAYLITKIFINIIWTFQHRYISVYPLTLKW